MKRVVVVGAGVGGLGSALALSRAGHEVVVLERDGTPMPERLEDAAAWDRQGAPQFHHSHIFLPRSRAILRDRLPDVYQALLEAGVPERTMGELMGVSTDLPGAEDLIVMPCRRTVFEWVLRRKLLEAANVELRTDVGVDGVVASSGPVPTVVGVRLANRAGALDADLVVVTTGRRGDVPGWLGQVGVEVAETVQESHLVYMTRFYQARRDRNLLGSAYWVGRRAGIGFSGFEADNRAFSITVGIWDTTDVEMRQHLHNDARYDATCRLLPELAPLVDPAQSRPITPVKVMGGLTNRLRRFLDDTGRPIVTGFFAVGDAYVVTNPVYGRGCTQALIQATHLADAIAAHPDEPTEQVLAYEAAAAREIVPWYHISVMMDQAQARADDGADFSLGAAGPGRFEGDPVAGVAFARVFGMLDPPDRLFSDPALMKTFAQRFEWGRRERSVADRSGGPRLTRDDILNATAAA
jgi:2-polyprenyl-6-methoxyphenol hydroxylase-like FAD-dependent oxidoreductase